MHRANFFPEARLIRLSPHAGLVVGMAHHPVHGAIPEGKILYRPSMLKVRFLRARLRECALTHLPPPTLSSKAPTAACRS